MNDDQAFLAALLAAPDDSAPWLVYADWLDERGDARGTYIRLVQSLAIKSDPELRKQLNAVRPTLPREWLAVVEQPKLLRANPTPYRALWSGFGLGDVRPTKATYEGTKYQTLPPVPFAWVLNFDEWAGKHTARFTPHWSRSRNSDGGMARLSEGARKRRLHLPAVFDLFFRRGHFQNFNRSPTDCTFRLAIRIASAPGAADARLIRFYSDSQGCLHWYLYLTPEGDSCVVCSAGTVNGWPGDEVADCWFCAPSFEEFVVRMWLENQAWSSLHSEFVQSHPSLMGAEAQAYLDHYRT